MPRKTRTGSLSLAAECAIPKIETDIRRRLFLAGMAGAACAFSSRPLSVQAASANRTTTSPDGIIRETLESYVNEAGEDFRLVLTTYPPGVGAPSHHHPSVGLNYVLEGGGGVAIHRRRIAPVYIRTELPGQGRRATHDLPQSGSDVGAQISAGLHGQERPAVSDHSVTCQWDTRGASNAAFQLFVFYHRM